MAYLSLYRRQRPLAFGEMTGQEHVSRTLSHALARGQLAHAYLFCGPRGTGKTTAAKILARAVNCRNYPAPEPCGECPPCRNIAGGVSLDVIEMDAASTRGIDEIRELRERTRYASSESRYKVYILDEAHMLTPEACNAFLKTLEEPPPGVIFILATTEASRLPATIVSRCQRFDFHLLTVEQIKDRLCAVAEKEQWQADDEALRLIARLAEGSLRDALGLLEQCHSYGEEIITAEHVRSVTGVTRAETIGSLIEALAGGDLETGLSVLRQVTYSGRDLPLFLRDLTFFFSRLLLDGGAPATRLEESYYGFETLLQRCRGKFSREGLLEVIELLHQVGGELRHAHYPQFVLEVALIRMLRVLRKNYGQIGVEAPPPTPPRKDAVAAGGLTGAPGAPVGAAGDGKAVPAERSTAGQGTAVSGREGITRPSPEAAAGGQEVSSAVRETAAGRAATAPEGPVDLNRDWVRIIQEVKKKQASTHSHLKAAHAYSLQGNLLVLTYRSDNYAAERILESSHRRLVENTVSQYYTRTIRIKIDLIDPEKPEAEHFPPADSTDEVHAGSGTDPGQDEVREAEEAYAFDDAVKLFPGQVIDLQEKEDHGDKRRNG